MDNLNKAIAFNTMQLKQLERQARTEIIREVRKPPIVLIVSHEAAAWELLDIKEYCCFFALRAYAIK